MKTTVLDGIDDHIIKLKQIEPWGYSTAYSLSAKFNLHRNYAEFLLGKGRLRAKQINMILSNIDESKKAAYDEHYIESLYEGFQNHEIDDKALISRLVEEFHNRAVLILAPGSSVTEKKVDIDRFIAEKTPLIISANYIPDNYKQDYVFCSNAMRYSGMEDKVEFTDNLLITSNLLDVCRTANVLNYSDLSFDDKGKCDNCVIMIMKLMLKLGKKQIFVAGFDGYRKDYCNYTDSYLASQHTKGIEENIRNTAYVTDLKKKMDIVFLTDSIYNR